MAKKSGYTTADLTSLAAIPMDAVNDEDCFLKLVRDDSNSSNLPAIYLWRKTTNTWVKLEAVATVDDTLASPASTGKLTQLFSWIAGRIKAITGKSSWLTAPAINLEDANTAIASKLNSSSYTASDVLAKLLTVDGATSGVDADLLDGQHGSYYAPINNAALTGVPTAPTAALNTNTTQIANCLFVINQIAALVNSSPTALDTLNELATALGNDANFATTITNALALKAPLNSPNFTGTVSGITASMVGLGNLTNTTQVDTSTNQSIAGNKTFTGTIKLNNATESTSTTTGALVISNGGMGVAGNLMVGGMLSTTQHLGGTNTGNAGFQAGLAGGGNVAVSLFGGQSNGLCYFDFAVNTGVDFDFRFLANTTEMVVDSRPTYYFNLGPRLKASLPTSPAGLPSGALWRNGNVVNIV